MSSDFSFDARAMKERNIIKYKGVEPPWELIEHVVKKSGLRTIKRFETVWGIPARSIDQRKMGARELPAKYWHIFYEFDKIKTAGRKKNKIAKKAEPKPEVNSGVLITNKQILDGFKKQ